MSGLVETRIGLHGAGCASVDGFGVAQPDGWRGKRCGWWIAASDRWHDPRTSVSIRQQRLGGTPVVQTKLGVPGGDVVQRVFVVADHGGRLVMQVENASPEPVVVAVPSGHMSTTAATGGMRPHGIETPSDVLAFPLSHRSTVTFAWALTPPRLRRSAPIDAGSLPTHDHVSRGWTLASDRASRLQPDATAMVAARSDVALMTVRDLESLAQHDAALGVLALSERVRMGDPVTEWMTFIADGVRRVARYPERSRWTQRALMLAARTLHAAGESTAVDDVVDLWQNVRHLATGLDAAPVVGDAPTATDFADAVERIAKLESRYLRLLTRNAAEVLPFGIPDEWRGVNVEAHGLVATPEHRVSMALRWHGPNLALLWEVDGPAGLQLTAPAVDQHFLGTAGQGEALLRMTQ